jgi:bifunctional DNase/RNase
LRIALAVALCAGAVQAIDEWRELLDGRTLSVRATEVARLGGGKAVLVLEADGGARLPVPLSANEAAGFERLLRGDRNAGLAVRSIDALGGRVLRARLDDVRRDRSIAAHLVVARGIWRSSVEVSAAEAVAIALQAGAPVETSREVVDGAAVSDEELRAFATDRARDSSRDTRSLRLFEL